MTKYILGIDIGTSGTKAMLLTTSGEVVAQKKDSYSFDTPCPGWAFSQCYRLAECCYFINSNTFFTCR
ncbi:FGGY family carbohydrate kinase [Leuconostoc inhae]|uniref:FGGY family carbohydrate kinase n=1 Tax=Leuconostoc inhae TaxID=178001 RepID=UPI0027E43CE6|nr:FGGY family carbohydrate kinase [Leuconostoc inhae]